ncbi:MAG TPA: Spy/CpxP family protein refolding chaperone [Thermoanaerobaculia bacterium]|nr:Spy/CpxP family protein refolding chaperone [Thermoanaerobaculia bacterium]
MSIQQVRRSVLIAAGIVALAVSGLVAGRIFGRQLAPSLGHGPRAARIYEHLASELNLSDAQRLQVRGVLKAHADEILGHAQAAMNARRAMRDAVMAPQPDEAAIKSLAAQMGNVHADGAMMIIRIRSEILPILTPEQQQKLVALHAKMGRKGDDDLQALAAFLKGES